MENTNAYQPDGLWLGLNTAVKVDHRDWISGAGKVPAPVMFVGGSPGRQETITRSCVAGDMGKTLRRELRHVGIDDSKVYYTFCVKYNTGKSKPVAADIRACREHLATEIKRVQPKIIVCMGKDALEAVVGKAYKFSVVRGVAVASPGYDLTEMVPASAAEQAVAASYGGTAPAVPTSVHYDLPETVVYATFNPAFLEIAPRELDAFRKELASLKRLMGEEHALAAADQGLAQYTKFVTINTAAGVKSLREGLFKVSDMPIVALDCEWHGESWYVKEKCLRTVQLGLDDGVAAVIEFTSSRPVPEGFEMYQSMDDPAAAMAELKLILEDPRIRIVGHNVKEDGLWLLQYGVDIRDHVAFDTMLAELLLNQEGPFGLEELALKYTPIPRWSVELEGWKTRVGKKWHGGGYGFIPPEILNPYAALDVIVTRAVFLKQLPLMTEYGKPRGKYPSLFDSVMQAQTTLYEIETVGLPIDFEMLDHMIALFEPKVDKLKQELVAKAAELGVEEFNPDSSKDVTELLFNRLEIVPFKTTKKTGGKLWSDAVRRFSIDAWDACDEVAPATDAMSLAVLADEHPLVADLLDYRRVGQIRKTWLRTPDADGEGGLYGCIGADGRLHPRFSMLTSTGRFRTAKPNSQNFPKKAQKFLEDIFAEELKTDPWLVSIGGKMPSLRQIVVPPPGHVLIEGDFTQAELFTMAALSGDNAMWKALTTPGLDLHDKTAIDGFGIEVVDEQGKPVREEETLEKAYAIWVRCGGGTTDFKKKQCEDEIGDLFKHFTYIDQTGRKMTRKQFKSSARVSAKAINFGIPYGREAKSISCQIKAETGSREPMESLVTTVQKMLDSWKTISYPTAWAYMQQCSHDAMTKWEVTNPWGRSRRFAPTTNRQLLAEYGRQGSNAPIQSTVADTCMIAMQLMVEERRRRNLHFQICNQVHDAIMTIVPVAEIQPMLQLYRDTMGNVEIPLPGRAPLILGVDIEIMERWGKEYKGPIAA